VFARFECSLDDLGLSEDGESDDDGVNVIPGQEGIKTVIPVVDVEMEVDDGFVEGE
jgi:hypothetical protein